MTQVSDRPAGSILGTRVLRTEDPGLLRGQNRYMNDLQVPGSLCATFVRSDVANAALGAVHVADAEAAPGVAAVFTADNLGVAPHHGFVTVHADFIHAPLATGRVRFVGEPIALVLAETVEPGGRCRGAGVGRLRHRRRPAGRSPGRHRRRGHRDLRRARLQPGARQHRPGRGRPGGGGRPGRPRRARALRQPAHGRGADGAQRLRGGARTGRPADVLRLDPDAPRPGRPARRGAGDRTRRSPRRHAAGRRRIRRQGRHLPGVLGGGRRGPVARSPGDVGADPQRGSGQPAAQSRPGAARRARRRRRRPVPRPAGAAARRRRRLSEHRRLPPRPHQADVERGVRDRRDPVRRRRGRDEHHTDRRLSGRRPPGGDRPARAPGRPGRPRARDRPDRAASAQPDRADGVPVHGPQRGGVRQRQLRAAARRRRRHRRLRRLARGAGAASCRG